MLIIGIVFNVRQNRRVNGGWTEIQAQVVGYEMFDHTPRMIFQFEYNGTTFRAIQSGRSLRQRDQVSITQIRDFVVNIRDFTIFVNPQVLENVSELNTFIYRPRNDDNIRYPHMLFSSQFNHYDPATFIAYADDTLTEQILRIPPNASLIHAENRFFVILIIVGSIVVLVGVFFAWLGLLDRKKTNRRRRTAKPIKRSEIFRDNTPIVDRRPIAWQEVRQPQYQSGECSVYLTSSSPNKIEIIKVIREQTGMSITDAKKIVDNAPQLVIGRISRQDAETIVNRLRGFNAFAEIRTEEHSTDTDLNQPIDWQETRKGPYQSGEYSVYLISSSPNKIDTIKAIRERTDMSITEAKNIVDDVPRLVIDGISKRDTETIVNRLREVNAIAEVRMYDC